MATNSRQQNPLKSCVIPSCTREARRTDRYLSYHQIPIANEERCEAWLRLIRTLRNDPHWIPKPSHKVCSRHFLDSHFSQPRGSPACLRYHIREDAFPTLHLGPSPSQPPDEEDDEVQIIENDSGNQSDAAAAPAAVEVEEKDFGGEKINLDCHEVTCPNCLHQFSFFLHGDENEDQNDPPPPRKRPKIATTFANNSSMSAPLSSRGNRKEVPPTTKLVEKDPLALEEDEENSSQVQIGIKLSVEEQNSRAQSQRSSVTKRFVYDGRKQPIKSFTRQSPSPKKANPTATATATTPTKRGKKTEAAEQQIRIVSVRSIAVTGRPTRCPSPDEVITRPSSPLIFDTSSSSDSLPTSPKTNQNSQNRVFTYAGNRVVKAVPISIIPTSANNKSADAAASEARPKVKLKERKQLPGKNPKGPQR